MGGPQAWKEVGRGHSWKHWETPMHRTLSNQASAVQCHNVCGKWLWQRMEVNTEGLDTHSDVLTPREHGTKDTSGSDPKKWKMKCYCQPAKTLSRQWQVSLIKPTAALSWEGGSVRKQKLIKFSQRGGIEIQEVEVKEMKSWEREGVTSGSQTELLLSVGLHQPANSHHHGTMIFTCPILLDTSLLVGTQRDLHPDPWLGDQQ